MRWSTFAIWSGWIAAAALVGYPLIIGNVPPPEPVALACPAGQVKEEHVNDTFDPSVDAYLEGRAGDFVAHPALFFKADERKTFCASEDVVEWVWLPVRQAEAKDVDDPPLPPLVGVVDGVGDVHIHEFMPRRLALEYYDDIHRRLCALEGGCPPQVK